VRRCLLCSLLLVSAGGAVAAPATLPDSGSLLLRAEEDRELCRELAAGQSLHYRFDANQALVFTAHYHRGDDARTLWRKDELRQEEGDLKAPMAARYCLTWFNYQEDALTLHWDVRPRP
jgi:hypothetical protein